MLYYSKYCVSSTPSHLANGKGTHKVKKNHRFIKTCNATAHLSTTEKPLSSNSPRLAQHYRQGRTTLIRVKCSPTNPYLSHLLFYNKLLRLALAILVNESGIIHALGDICRVEFGAALSVAHLLSTERLSVHAHDSHFAIGSVLRQNYLHHIALRHHTHTFLALHHKSSIAQVIKRI